MGWLGRRAHDLKNTITNDVDYDKSYSVRVVCTNCDRQISVRIKHGKSVEDWNKHAKCANCKSKYTFVKSRDYF
jgi:hypothetical protein